MNILFCGDVVGKSGRNVILEKIPELKAQLKLDFIVVNGENAAHGFGITKKIYDQFVNVGVDVVTAGDHCFDRDETRTFIGSTKNLLRPANLPPSLPGKGHGLFETIAGKKILVIHLHAQLFMKLMTDCPFACVDKILETYKLQANTDAIIVDFHGEASSERMAMAHHLDGRVSVLVGSHTHVPTADVQIFPKGMAYQTDAGMCGDYNSVIGFKPNVSVQGFRNKVRDGKLQVANGDATLCGLFVQIDSNIGEAIRAEPVRIGGRLASHIPQI